MSSSSLMGLARSAGAIAMAAARKWVDDRAPSMGAALAYYTAFSIAPLLVIVIAIAGLTVGHDAAQTAIVAQLGDLLGESGGKAVAGMLQATSDLGTGTLALGIGIATLLLGATTAFAELQDDLDRIWAAEPSKASGIWNLVRTRLLSFGMVLCVAFLLTISLVVNACIAAVGQYMFGGSEVALQALNFVASVLVIMLLFAAIYKVLPNTPIAWRDVWEGALITSILFAVGKLLIGLYIGKSSVASAFGSAGPFVALMVWIYYSTQVFLFGAEVTCVVARARNGDPAPAASAGVPKGAVDTSKAGSGRPTGAPGGGSVPPLPALARAAIPAIEPGPAAKRLFGASAAGLLAGWAAARIVRARMRSTG
ncbi:MAG: YihY/virulence factor BrkB family protein [Betaproteobacteria bacterium]